MNLIAQTTQAIGPISGMKYWTPLDWGSFFTAAGIFIGIVTTGIVTIIKARASISCLSTKTEATAQLATNLASNQRANPASSDPIPALVAAVKETLDAPAPPATTQQPMQVKT